MHLQHGSDESAVLLLHEEAAYADLGTTTPELILAPARVTIVRLACLPRRVPPSKAQDWSNWSWATAPPRRAA